MPAVLRAGVPPAATCPRRSRRRSAPRSSSSPSACARTESNIPDPTANGGGGFGFRQAFRSIDRNSPAFQAAAKACQSLRPRFGRGGPGGAAPSAPAVGPAGDGRHGECLAALGGVTGGGSAAAVGASGARRARRSAIATNAASSRGASNAAEGQRRRDRPAPRSRRHRHGIRHAQLRRSADDLQSAERDDHVAAEHRPGGQARRRRSTRSSGEPVILMDGTVPAYRDLSGGVTDGPDVKELKQNLVALGFDPSHQITIDDTFDAATTTAVDAWQASLGQTADRRRVARRRRVPAELAADHPGEHGARLDRRCEQRIRVEQRHRARACDLGPAQAEFVSLTTTATTTSTTTSTSTTSSATTAPSCPSASTISAATAAAAQRAASDCPLPNNPGRKSSSQALQLQALIALLKAERRSSGRRTRRRRAAAARVAARGPARARRARSAAVRAPLAGRWRFGRRWLGRRRALERWLRGRRLQPGGGSGVASPSAGGSGTAMAPAMAPPRRSSRPPRPSSS